MQHLQRNSNQNIEKHSGETNQEGKARKRDETLSMRAATSLCSPRAGERESAERHNHRACSEQRVASQERKDLRSGRSGSENNKFEMNAAIKAVNNQQTFKRMRRRCRTQKERCAVHVSKQKQ